MDVELGEIRMDEDDEDMGENGSLRRAVRSERTDRLGDGVDDMEIDKSGRIREPGKHKSKDRKRSRREEKEHGSKDKEEVKEREKDDTRGGERLESSRERRKEEKSEYGRDREHEKDRDREKERSRDRAREKDYERDKYREKDRELERPKDRGKEHDRERERSIDRERGRGRDRGKDKGREHEKEREAERERDLVREHDRGKEREKDRDRDRDRDRERKEKDREKGKDREKARENERDRLKDRERDKEKTKNREKEREIEKDKLERDKGKDKSRQKEIERSQGADQDNSRARESEIARGEKNERVKYEEVHDEDRRGTPMASSLTHELEERSKKMKEERLQRKSDGGSEISSWVSKSRRLEKRTTEKDKTMRLSKALEEQDNLLAESEDEEATVHSEKDLAGVKILHGLDKVVEGGAVVLTLKDQNILADGDVNEEVDMLENVEIGEQKQRDEAYKAAKKKTGIYDDKFSDDMGSRKTILPQYDDPVEDEGVTLDETGHFTDEAEKKLEELRRRIEGSNAKKNSEDLTSSGKILTDYYTPDEMLQFKKPKKKKSLRKKEKLDLDALEAEAIASGLGSQDLGSRNDLKRQTAKEEQERAEAEKRSNAYQSAYAKAEEASKMLRQEQTLTVQSAEDDNLVFGEEYEDLQRSLEQARKLALKKQTESAATGPQAVALIAMENKEQADTQSLSEGEPSENKVVITEMEEFVLGLQLNEEIHKPESEDVFKDEDEVPGSPEQETKAEPSGWSEVKEIDKTELPAIEQTEDVAPDEIIHEVSVGKGLSGALKLLKERGTLKESIDWGGRNMDKKKSKLVGIRDNDGPKEIHIERTDEFGRIMTPKEAFRVISHKFHGKGPGKMKQEKRMKQYQEDLKTKQMKASDTPLMAMEKMREAQARLKTPYLVLSGHVKPGQTSDPRSGFATVEKDHLGSLTPMLGDKKVEHFLGINRKADSGSMGPPPPKKPKS